MFDPAVPDKAPMPVRLWRSRELIFTLIKRDLKIRYKSSSLGFLWSFGRPLFLMLVIWAVFSLMVRIPSSHPWLPFSLHLLTGLLPWMFMANAVSESLYSVIGNSNVVKKVWLPVEVFPASVVGGQLIHLVLATLPFAAFVTAYALFGHVPNPDGSDGVRLGMLVLPNLDALLIPFVVVLQTLLAFGICLIVSSLNVFYRDMASIVEIVLNAWFYVTPVIYPAQLARDTLKAHGLDVAYWIWLANPMTPITLAYRRLMFGNLFDGAPEVSDGTLLLGLGIATVTTLIVLGIGVVMFGRMSRRFADEL
ncbi:MAG: lipopolysaccharide transport system permease protein [Candidatus Sumerlaeota bacterium]|nr:lipopolysaccharide transport system permease protein [Candidatus Sumerlaeota bacterium]